MVANSRRHHLVVAEGNNHDILEENPGLVLNVITELVNRIKSE